MAKKPKTDKDVFKEILDGVDAVGTIVEEDLGYLKKRISEFQETLNDLKKSINSLQLDQKTLENNQSELLESIRFITDKLNFIESRFLSEGDLDDTLPD